MRARGVCAAAHLRADVSLAWRAQDLKDAMTVAELTDVLGLLSVRSHEWHVQPSCALTGEGLHDGLAWIVQKVTKAGLVPVQPGGAEEGAAAAAVGA